MMTEEFQISVALQTLKCVRNLIASDEPSYYQPYALIGAGPKNSSRGIEIVRRTRTMESDTYEPIAKIIRAEAYDWSIGKFRPELPDVLHFWYHPEGYTGSKDCTQERTFQFEVDAVHSEIQQIVSEFEELYTTLSNSIKQPAFKFIRMLSSDPVEIK